MSAFTMEQFAEELGLEIAIKNTKKRFLVHTENGHYKYYIMDFGLPGFFVKCQYGRIGAAPQWAQYNNSTAEKKYREKLAKGYREVTLFSELKELGIQA